MLVHLLKSFRAYNVNSTSTLFSDNSLWNFEISFPCARFNNLLGNNLITNLVNKAARDSEDIMFLYLSLFTCGEKSVMWRNFSTSKAFNDGYGDIGILGTSWILTDILGSVGPLRLAKSSSVSWIVNRTVPRGWLLPAPKQFFWLISCWIGPF